MDFRKCFVDLVRRENLKRVVEVGVWRGDLSRMLWKLPLERLVLVDPMAIEGVHIWHDGCGGRTKTGRGKMDVCTCSCRLKKIGKTWTQEELDGFWSELRSEAPEWVEMIRLPSLGAAKRFESGSLDVVFIDAVHLYEDVCADIDAWLPKIRSGGWLCGDDYGREGVRRAVGEKLPEHFNEGRFWGFAVP